MPAANATPEVNGLRVFIDQSTGKGTTLRFYFVADYLRPAAKKAGVQIADLP
jgi:hypothetical protein